MAIGAKAISRVLPAASAASGAAWAGGNSMRNPVAARISPPATRMPGIEIPKKSMIAEPTSRKTTNRMKA